MTRHQNDSSQKLMTRYQIPSISELRTITQAAKRHNTDWHYVIHRRLSIYITWLLLHTSLTANQVTLFSFLCGLLGAVVVVIVPGWWNVSGFILFYGYFILDKVDGEIARFRKQRSLRGMCLDYIGHIMIPPLVPLSVGGFLARRLLIGEFWLPGALAALAIMFLRVGRDIPFRMILTKLAAESDLFKHKEGKTINRPLQSQSASRGRKSWATAVMETLRFSSSFWQSLFLLVSARVISLLWSPGIWLFAGVFLFLCFTYIVIAMTIVSGLVWNIEKHIDSSLEQVMQTSETMAARRRSD